jgi:two-component system cell cycle sensor histidine kinase/response regulator CckA
LKLLVISDDSEGNLGLEIRSRLPEGAFIGITRQALPEGDPELLVIEADLTLDQSIRLMRELRGRFPSLVAAIIESRDEWALAALDSVGYAVLAADTSNSINLINRAAESLTGWDRAEAIGKPIEQVFRATEEGTGRTIEGLAQAALRGETRHLGKGTLLASKDGRRRAIEGAFAPIKGRRGQQVAGIVVYFRDVALEQSERIEAARRQRLELFYQVAGNIADEFGQILTAISAEGQAHNLETKQALLRAKELIEDLQFFSKTGLAKRVSHIAPIISEAARRALVGSEINCSMRLPGDLWLVEVDAERLSRALYELILNARRAMSSKGRLLLSAENVVLGEGQEPPLQAGNYIAITISDTGKGMSARDIERVFDPYFAAGQGAGGLGLTAAYKAISECGGIIKVSSEEGSGSTFRIYLRAAAEGLPASGEDNLSRARILVMDEEESIRNVVAEMLRYLGYEVELAKDGAEAIELYRAALSAGDPFKAVILDLTVSKGMGGLQVIERLLEIDPGVRAIISSGYSGAPAMVGFRKYGFKGAIAKPYGIEELKSVLRMALDEPA